MGVRDPTHNTLLVDTGPSHAVILNVHTMKFCVLELATLDSSNINIYLSDLYNTLGAKNQNGGCSWKIISAVVLESPKTHPPASTDTDAS